jgi:hypothetical protein
MKTYQVVEVYCHELLKSALEESYGQLHAPTILSSAKDLQLPIG